MYGTSYSRYCFVSVIILRFVTRAFSQSPPPLPFRGGGTYSAAGQAWFVGVGDFNADGKLDLAVADVTGARVSVLLGNGDGTFSVAVNFVAGPGPISVWWGTSMGMAGRSWRPRTR